MRASIFGRVTISKAWDIGDPLFDGQQIAFTNYFSAGALKMQTDYRDCDKCLIKQVFSFLLHYCVCVLVCVRACVHVLVHAHVHCITSQHNLQFDFHICAGAAGGHIGYHSERVMNYHGHIIASE